MNVPDRCGTELEYKGSSSVRVKTADARRPVLVATTKRYKIQASPNSGMWKRLIRQQLPLPLPRLPLPLPLPQAKKRPLTYAE